MKKAITFSVNTSEGVVSTFARDLLDDFTVGGYRFIRVGGYNTCEFNGPYHNSPNIAIEVEGDNLRYSPLQIPTRCHNGIRVQITRKRKATYNSILNNIFKDAPNYYPIYSWSRPSVCPDAIDRWVFRPTYGARGLGIGLVPEGRTPEWTSIELQNANLHPSPTQLAEIGIVFKGDGELKDAHAAESALVALRGQGFEFVPYIPNVIHEVRLITDYQGKFKIAVVRDRVECENGMKMAIGSEATPDKIIDLDVDLRKLPFNVSYIIENLKAIPHMPMHSFDLFVTKDKLWGFFEASCQYGQAAVPPGFTHTNGMKYMEMLAKLYEEYCA